MRRGTGALALVATLTATLAVLAYRVGTLPEPEPPAAVTASAGGATTGS